MINRNEYEQNYDDIVIEKVKELHKLISSYENKPNSLTKNKLNKKIVLFNYYINTINSIKNETTKSETTLKLGTHFKRTK